MTLTTKRIPLSSADDYERSLSELRALLAERERTVAMLKDALRDHERLLSTLQAHLTAYEHEVESIKQTAEQLEEQIASLDDQPEAGESSEEYKVALALTLANAAYDALLVVNQDMKVIAINDAAEELFGRKRPIGEPLIDVTNSPELEALVSDAISNEEESLEEQLTLNRRVYRVRVRVIRRVGRAFIGVALQDVTDLVRLNRARRDMVANISHELRTPIANIRLIIDSLFHEQDKPKRKQSTSALRAIARETDSLLWLVQELLDLSMIESGQAILRMIDQPLRPIVEEVVERMADQSEAKDLRVQIEIGEDIEVLADADQVRRVLLNLLHNAIKWSPPNEVITIQAENAGDKVMVSVLDRGPGVPDDQTERIFERFYQVDPSRSGGDGTGLGLAICKHIVEAHEGRIWAEGNLGGKQGGVFRFTLPRAEITAESLA